MNKKVSYEMELRRKHAGKEAHRDGYRPDAVHYYPIELYERFIEEKGKAWAAAHIANLGAVENQANRSTSDGSQVY